MSIEGVMEMGKDAREAYKQNIAQVRLFRIAPLFEWDCGVCAAGAAYLLHNPGKHSTSEVITEWLINHYNITKIELSEFERGFDSHEIYLERDGALGIGASLAREFCRTK